MFVFFSNRNSVKNIDNHRSEWITDQVLKGRRQQLKLPHVVPSGLEIVVHCIPVVETTGSTTHPLQGVGICNDCRSKSWHKFQESRWDLRANNSPERIVSNPGYADDCKIWIRFFKGDADGVRVPSGRCMPAKIRTLPENLKSCKAGCGTRKKSRVDHVLLGSLS